MTSRRSGSLFMLVIIGKPAFISNYLSISTLAAPDYVAILNPFLPRCQPQEELFELHKVQCPHDLATGKL